MTDLGGESACWAHLLPESDTRAVGASHVDIAALAGPGRGALWSLPHDGDLDANLVQLPAGDEIASHVNNEVDVFMVVMGGDGVLVADGHSYPLRTGVAVLVPRGAARTIRAGGEPLRYFTVHRRRAPLAIRPVSRADQGGTS